MTSFVFDSVSADLVQNVINEMSGWGFDLSHTARLNEYSVSGHGIVGSASYDAGKRSLTVTIIEKQGLSKLIPDGTINDRLLQALGRA